MPPHNPRSQSAKSNGRNRATGSRVRKKPKARRTELVHKRNLLPEDVNASAAAVNCDSESVRERLHRIQSNYLLLDQLLTDIESRAPFLEDGVSADPKKPR